MKEGKEEKMRKKIIGIVILMLVATTVVSATNINMKESNKKIVNHEPYEPTLFDWWNVDQKQTKQCGYGMMLIPPVQFAQGFTPTKDELTAVALFLCNFYYESQDPILITVAIRDSLNGTDLVTKTISANKDTIPSTATKWVVFDFDDISITPGSQYFIICSGNAGSVDGGFSWVYNDEDSYTGGEAWYKDNETANWTTWLPADLDPQDFCFKTYFRKPLDISTQINNEVTMPVSYKIAFLPFWEQLFEQFPHAFPILRNLLGY